MPVARWIDPDAVDFIATLPDEELDQRAVIERLLHVGFRSAALTIELLSPEEYEDFLVNAVFG